MKELWKQFLSFLKSQKSLASIGIADSIGLGISAVFWFYLALLIDTDKFGEIHYFIGVAGIAYTLSLVGAPNAVTIFTAKNLKIESTLFFMSFIGGLIVSIIVFVMFYKFDVVLLLFGYIINDLSIAYLLGKKFYRKYSNFLIIQKMLTLILGLGFFYLFGAQGILFALALSYAHFVIIIYKSFKNSKINFSALKSRSGFVINNYVYNLAGGFRGNIDRILIAPLLGFAVLGNYAISLQFISILMIFSTVTYKYLIAHDATGGLNVKLKRGVIILSIVISILGATVFPQIISFVFPKYVNAIEAIQIMSFKVVPATVTLIYTSKFLGSEKSKFVLISLGLNVITETTGIILLGSMFGIVGIAVSFVLGSISSAMFLVISDKLLR